MITLIKKFFFEKAPIRLLIIILNIKSTFLFKVKKIEKNIYRLDSEDIHLFISRPHRLFKYKNGVRNRFDELKNKYFISEISFNENDIIVDIGSNIGELPKAIRMDLTKNVNFIAIEPDPIEFEVLKRNLMSSDYSFNQFLSVECGQVQVQYDNNSGDTHLITNDHMGTKRFKFRSIKSVEACSLDRLLASLNLKSIKLLKIEVEGAEPEVLLGSLQILKMVNFIAVDTGPERGVYNTFEAVQKILENLEFALIRKNYPYSVLFQSKKYRT